MSLYHLKNLSFSYQLGVEKQLVLDNLNLTICKGDFVCIHGPSGSGKSTLLNILGLMTPPQDEHGEITFLGQNLRKLSEKEQNQLRRFDLGFIFQQFHLIPTLSAFENVEFFLARQGRASKERKRLVEEALRQVDLWDRRHHRPNELSGGQCQRVAIARAIVKKPRVIIGDEPTANLDQHNGREVMRILKDLNQQHQVAIILASHDRMVIEQSPRQIQLKDGHILNHGE